MSNRNKKKIDPELIIKKTVEFLKKKNTIDLSFFKDSPRNKSGSWAQICIGCIGCFDFKVAHMIQKRWKENYGIFKYFINFL
jgi:hypothetical protein